MGAGSAEARGGFEPETEAAVAVGGALVEAGGDNEADGESSEFEEGVVAVAAALRDLARAENTKEEGSVERRLTRDSASSAAAASA